MKTVHTDLLIVTMAVVVVSRERETSQPVEREPVAKVHTILRVPFPYWNTDTDWSPDVTVWNRDPCMRPHLLTPPTN